MTRSPKGDVLVLDHASVDPMIRLSADENGCRKQGSCIGVLADQATFPELLPFGHGCEGRYVQELSSPFVVDLVKAQREAVIYC